ncbi:hypothetical protein DMUE_6282, partial [Dictyocoela muelleri]
MTKRINILLLMLEEYNYELRHIIGEDNNEADILSRSLLINKDISSTCKDVLNQTQDIIKKLNELKSKSKTEKTMNLILKYIADLHILLVHPGRNKLFNTIRNYLKIKNLKKIINSVCKRCMKCQEEKSY